MLILPGGLGNSSYIRLFIPYLADKYTLYSIDYRGYGKSDRTSSQYRFEDIQKDIESFIRDIIKQPVFIFGLSAGGWFGSMVTAHSPDVVKGLIIGDTPLFAKKFLASPEFGKVITRWKNITTSSKSSLDLVHEMRDLSGEGQLINSYQIFGIITSARQVDPEFYGMFTSDLDELLTGYDPDMILPAIKCPFLLVTPRKGSILTEKVIKRTLDAISHDHRYHIVLEAEGHSLRYGELLSNLIHGFITAVIDER